MLHDTIFLILGLILVALLLVALKGFWAAYTNILKDIENDPN